MQHLDRTAPPPTSRRLANPVSNYLPPGMARSEPHRPDYPQQLSLPGAKMHVQRHRGKCGRLSSAGAASPPPSSSTTTFFLLTPTHHNMYTGTKVLSASDAARRPARGWRVVAFEAWHGGRGEDRHGAVKFFRGQHFAVLTSAGTACRYCAIDSASGPVIGRHNERV